MRWTYGEEKTVTATLRTIIAAALPAALALTACDATVKPDVEEDVSELAVEQKADTLAGKVAIVGSLVYGQTSDPVPYKNPPKFRAFKFAGDKGDKVTVTVRSTDGGDAVAWILNDSFQVLGYNDDATDGSLDAVAEATLGGNKHPDIRTYYVVFRDYGLRKRSFTVELQGVPVYTQCNVDSDCQKVGLGCCGLTFTAIRAGMEDAYHAALGCDETPICPAVMPQLTDDVPQCNPDSHTCELVDPNVIRCGGRTLTPQLCPEGYVCTGPGLAVDIPGVCRRMCGGLADVACPSDFTCIDDPNDDCDPNDGGRDCHGICQPRTCGGFGNLSCPESLECIEDTADDCDPDDGGADCGDICVFH